MENISKKVVDTTTGKIIGYVLDVAIDYQRLMKEGYYIVDNETESEFLLRNADISSSIFDFLLVDEVSKLEFVAEKKSSLLGKTVLDETGFSLGTIYDVCFEKLKCCKIVTEKAEILPKYLKNIGQDIVFVSFKKKHNKKISKTNFPKMPENDIVVEIQKTIIPEKINLSTSFYLGKVSNQDILGYNNERIVSKGEKVTKNIVEKAKLHNKINQLFFAIKR